MTSSTFSGPRLLENLNQAIASSPKTRVHDHMCRSNLRELIGSRGAEARERSDQGLGLGKVI